MVPAAEASHAASSPPPVAHIARRVLLITQPGERRLRLRSPPNQPHMATLAQPPNRMKMR